jgi:hypothetical protein
VTTLLPDWTAILGRPIEAGVMPILREIASASCGCVFAMLVGGMSMTAAEQKAVGHETVGQDVSRDVLIGGAGAIADGNSPAVVTIDLGKVETSSQALLELALTPIAVSPDEQYQIVVSANPANGAGAWLGGSASYPPLRPSEVRRILVPLPRISPEMRAKGDTQVNLSVRLVPADPDKKLTGSSVRVVGVRVVGA